MMVKDATTRKTWLPASVTFWVSLLVSSAGIHGLSLQAIASVSQPASSVETSAEASTVNQITPVAEISSGKGNINTNSVQDRVSMPPVAPLEDNPVESSAELPTLDDVPSVAELSSGEGNMESNDSMSQVTNVTQLRDVSPGDWAFEALRSLVERYGCIAGYPDGTYRGNRSTSRYEFAAGLNACLQQIEKLIASGTANFVTKED